jgi:hypothetical protein
MIEYIIGGLTVLFMLIFAIGSLFVKDGED